MTRRRDLARSVRLFRSFLLEQTQPAVFYGALADDSVADVREWTDPAGQLVLDVGAGPAEFARAFRAAGARYVPLDHDRRVASVRDGGLVAEAVALPFEDGSIDIVFSSNLWEHVADPAAVGDELIRVLRPGGLLLLSYTNWLSPWGGHETSPWHWLGGEYAVRRYQRREGRPPKNRVDRTLFRVSVGTGLRWAQRQPDAHLLTARPRYLPDRARLLVHVPGIREIVTWNLLLVLRKR